MGVASLVLGIISIVFGVLPLLPLGGPATLVLAALGLPLGVVGLCLGLMSRSEALLVKRAIGLYTAGLSTAVIGTLLCTAWVGGLIYAQRKIHYAAQACVKDPRACASINLPRLSLTPVPAPLGSAAAATPPPTPPPTIN